MRNTIFENNRINWFTLLKHDKNLVNLKKQKCYVQFYLHQDLSVNPRVVFYLLASQHEFFGGSISKILFLVIYSIPIEFYIYPCSYPQTTLTNVFITSWQNLFEGGQAYYYFMLPSCLLLIIFYFMFLIFQLILQNRNQAW